MQPRSAVPPLFPPWSNTAFGLALVAGGLAVVALPLVPMAYVRTPYQAHTLDPIEQPVEFDHRHHYDDDGIDCLYCHHFADRSPVAGVPASSLCMGCHAQVWNESPLLEMVKQSYFEGDAIAWRRVTRLPDFVFFDHRAHVNRGVGCVTCHGHVEEMAHVFKVEPMSMQWCLDCHRDPAPHLRPLEAITDMDWAPGHPAREIGREIQRALNIDPPTYCSGCHR